MSSIQSVQQYLSSFPQLTSLYSSVRETICIAIESTALLNTIQYVLRATIPSSNFNLCTVRQLEIGCSTRLDWSYGLGLLLVLFFHDLVSLQGTVRGGKHFSSCLRLLTASVTEWVFVCRVVSCRVAPKWFPLSSVLLKSLLLRMNDLQEHNDLSFGYISGDNIFEFLHRSRFVFELLKEEAGLCRIYHRIRRRSKRRTISSNDTALPWEAPAFRFWVCHIGEPIRCLFKVNWIIIISTTSLNNGFSVVYPVVSSAQRVNKIIDCHPS